MYSTSRLSSGLPGDERRAAVATGQGSRGGREVETALGFGAGVAAEAAGLEQGRNAVAKQRGVVGHGAERRESHDGQREQHSQGKRHDQASFEAGKSRSVRHPLGIANVGRRTTP